MVRKGVMREITQPYRLYGAGGYTARVAFWSMR